MTSLDALMQSFPKHVLLCTNDNPPYRQVEFFFSEKKCKQIINTKSAALKLNL